MIFVESKYWLVLAVIIATFLVTASFGLTSSPRFWFDEGINLQIARNFAEQGYLNIQTAPGQPYENPYQFLTTGYPVNGLLGVVFKATGFSFAVARGYMLLWMAALLLSVFLVSKRLFGPLPALFSVLLISTFPPIVFHGKSLIGEIPGLTLFLFGLWAFDIKERKSGLLWSVLSGFLLGLSAAAKPVFLLFAVAVALSYFWGRKIDRRKEAAFLFSLLLPVAFYIYTILPPEVGFSQIGALVETYQSRASQGSFGANISENIARFFTDDALVYTLFATALAALAMPWRIIFKREWERPKVLFAAAAFLQLLFFIQGVGWNRYLVVYQGMILLILPAVVFKLTEKYSKLRDLNGRFFKNKMAVCALLVLTLFQIYYLSYRSDFFSGSLGADLEKFFTEKAPKGRIYAVSALKSVAMIPTERLWQFFLFEDRQVMPNLLQNLSDEKFEYLFLDPDDPDAIPYEKEILRLYEPVGEVGEKILFKLK